MVIYGVVANSGQGLAIFNLLSMDGAQAVELIIINIMNLDYIKVAVYIQQTIQNKVNKDAVNLII